MACEAQTSLNHVSFIHARLKVVQADMPSVGRAEGDSVVVSFGWDHRGHESSFSQTGFHAVICEGLDEPAVESIGPSSGCSRLGIFDSGWWLDGGVSERSNCGIGGSFPRNIAVPASARQVLGMLQNCFTRTQVPRAITVATARAWKTLYLAVTMAAMTSCMSDDF
jgi:hypothetical protein